MEPIRNFDQLTSHLKTLNKRKRIAVLMTPILNMPYPALWMKVLRSF